MAPPKARGSGVGILFITGLGCGLTYYMVMRKYWFPNPYKTREVQNIEDRFTAGGGTPTHTPATATKRGDPNHVESKHAEMKGPDSEHFKDKISDQKGEAGKWPEKLYKLLYDNPKGK